MKIVFIGTVEFSYKALSAIIEHDFEVVGIVTKKQSKFNADFYDLTPIAKNYNIPIIFKENNNDDKIISFLKSKAPDIIYCFGWSHLLPEEILSIAPYGVIGFHPAELPFNRGRHPIIWALFLGLKQTASTFFIMDKSADTGDIISQEIVEITEEDTASTLYQKISNIGLKQILEFSKEFNTKGKDIKRIIQNKTSGNSWRKRGKEDGRIDFRMTTDAIYNLVRALTHPYVGAHIQLNNWQEVKVWKVIRVENKDKNYEPGKVLDVEGNNIIVKTYDGAIKITEHGFNELPKKGEYL